MAPVGPKTEIVHGGKKYRIFHKVTNLMPRHEPTGEDVEAMILTPEKDGVVDVVVLSPREDLTEEALALRVKWFLEARAQPVCVKCGARYNGKNYLRVLNMRNGTYFLHAVCDKCEPRITWAAAAVLGVASFPKRA